MTPAIVICVMAYVSDADTVRCKDGTRVRLAGISALERDGSCNSAPACPTMPFAQATDIAQRITAGRTYRFTIVGRSGKRLVGDNKGLRCRIIASKAAVRWDRWWRQYRLRDC